MAFNYLITGYGGEPHVTAENDRGINAAIFGAGRFVLPVGEQFRAEYIGNNTVRMYDGKLMDNGAAAGIPAGEHVDLLIPYTEQGQNRNDLIVFQYSQDSSTLIETGSFIVVSGTPTTGTATDPALTQEDLLTNTAVFDQVPLWRVSVSGAAISAPVQLFKVSHVDDVALGAAEAALAKANEAKTDAASAQTTANKGVADAASAQTSANNAQNTANSALDKANAAATTATYTASVSTSWTEDATNGGYYQTVSVEGILATDNPVSDVVLGSDIDANALYLEAWGLVTRITTDAGSVTLWANEEAPTTAFTVQFMVVR